MDFIVVKEHKNINDLGALVPFSDPNSETVVFFIHPVGGSIMCYTPLIKLLNHEFSYYGIQAKHLDFDLKFPDSMDEIALSYTKLIPFEKVKKVYLIGWSFGGNIAFQMSQILQSNGVENIKLIMIDSFYGKASVLPNMDNIKHIIKYFMKDLLQNKDFEFDINELTIDLEENYHYLLKHQMLSAHIDFKLFLRIFKLYKNNLELNCKYAPNGPYQTPIYYLCSQGSADKYHKYMKDFYEKENIDVSVSYLEGDHYTIMTLPHVRKLALKIDNILS